MKVPFPVRELLAISAITIMAIVLNLALLRLVSAAMGAGVGSQL